MTNAQKLIEWKWRVKLIELNEAKKRNEKKRKMISLTVGWDDSIPRSIKDFLPTSYRSLTFWVKILNGNCLEQAWKSEQRCAIGKIFKNVVLKAWNFKFIEMGLGHWYWDPKETNLKKINRISTATRFHCLCLKSPGIFS